MVRIQAMSGSRPNRKNIGRLHPSEPRSQPKRHISIGTTGILYNGSTGDFDSPSRGSNPCVPANLLRPRIVAITSLSESDDAGSIPAVSANFQLESYTLFGATQIEKVRVNKEADWESSPTDCTVVDAR